MKTLATFICAVCLLTACDKEQKKIDTLDGTWRISAAQNNGTAITASSYANVTYTFKTCVIKKAEYCQGTYKVGTQSESFLFRLADEDKKIEIDFESPALDDIYATFTQDTDSKIHWVYDNANNESLEITLEKN